MQEELVQYCRSKGITVAAYTPTGTILYSSFVINPLIYASWGKERVRSDPVIVEISKKYNATPTQVILSWHLARGIPILPKSANEQRQKENLDVSYLIYRQQAQYDINSCHVAPSSRNWRCRENQRVG